MSASHPGARTYKPFVYNMISTRPNTRSWQGRDGRRHPLSELTRGADGRRVQPEPGRRSRCLVGDTCAFRRPQPGLHITGTCDQLPRRLPDFAGALFGFFYLTQRRRLVRGPDAGAASTSTSSWAIHPWGRRRPPLNSSARLSMSITDDRSEGHNEQVSDPSANIVVMGWCRC